MHACVVSKKTKRRQQGNEGKAVTRESLDQQSIGEGRTGRHRRRQKEEKDEIRSDQIHRKVHSSQFTELTVPSQRQGQKPEEDRPISVQRIVHRHRQIERVIQQPINHRGRVCDSVCIGIAANRSVAVASRSRRPALRRFFITLHRTDHVDLDQPDPRKPRDLPQTA